MEQGICVRVQKFLSGATDVVSLHVGAGDGTQIPCKNSQCSNYWAVPAAPQL